MISVERILKPCRPENTGSRHHFIQPKLTINNPDDAYEKEADAVADEIMRMSPEQDHLNSGASANPISAIRGKCSHCKEEENQMHRKKMSNEEIYAGNNLENYLENISGSGASLSKEVRNFYEPRFGYDFSNVKVHTDRVASKSAQSINALAYTSGSDIVFNTGQYSPGSDRGRRLLGHELTHVVQQQGDKGAVQRDPKPEPKTKCTWGDYVFEEIEISGIRLLIGMESAKRSSIEPIKNIAAQIISDNKIIADPAFQVKKCIISPNTTRFALLNGEPVLVLDPIHANIESVRHEMGHAVSHFLLNNKSYKINKKVESGDWLSALTDIFLQLNQITIKNIKGDEMFANFIVDPTEWNPGASAEHPGDVDEFFASAKEAFQTDKKALSAVFAKYGKQNSKIPGLGKKLIQLLEFLFNAGKLAKTGVVSSKDDIEATIGGLSQPSKVEETLSAHLLTEMLLNPDKRPQCK